MRRGAEASSEPAREGVAVDAGFCLQSRGTDRTGGGVEQVARGNEGFRADARYWRQCAGMAREGIGESGNEGRESQIFDRLREIDNASIGTFSIAAIEKRR